MAASGSVIAPAPLLLMARPGGASTARLKAKTLSLEKSKDTPPRAARSAGGAPDEAGLVRIQGAARQAENT